MTMTIVPAVMTAIVMTNDDDVVDYYDCDNHHKGTTYDNVDDNDDNDTHLVISSIV